ncbi:MAG: 16S rRNA (guanine(527)-N(7))-methyltransferase RsmG [Nocardioidaceae bacterium]|nr:16S rRNA (guanine(527)-N(7))-methyltransferase RsmG [Nocardioidaceae bacterium]
MCGPQLPELVRYARLLVEVGLPLGLLGPREVPRLWDRHLLNCAAVAPALRAGSQVVDVGSGAGLPGLVWALLRNDLDIVLLEPLLRRADFLGLVVAELGLPHVRVERARAEAARDRYAADVVAARAVAPLPRLVTWTMPLLRPGGRLLAFKGESAAAELAAAAAELSTAGTTSAVVTTYGEGILDPPTRVVEVTAGPGQDQARSAQTPA